MSDQNKQRIASVLENIANHELKNTGANFNDLVSSAIKYGIKTKDDFAAAMGCAPDHVVKKAASMKYAPFAKVLQSLGFGSE